MIADVPEPPTKPETTPEVVATDRLPPSSYVTTPPPTDKGGDARLALRKQNMG